jgi:hypothetical protein
VCFKGNSSESLVIGARINQQYLESKKAPRLEQEINLHPKEYARTVKQITNCFVFPFTWSYKTSITYLLVSVCMRMRACVRGVPRCAAGLLPGLLGRGKF